MNQQYHHIFNIDFFHNYYGGDKFNGFTVNWTSETASLMDNLQVMVKPGFGGISILCSDIELLSSEDSTIFLRISPKDPLFFNYTDFGQEFSPKAGIFLFSNDKGINKNGVMHQEDYVSTKDCIKVINREVVQEIASKFNDSDFQVWEGIEPVLELRHFTGLMSEISEKVFFIEKNKNRQAFYKPRGGMEKKPFGLIALNVFDIYSAYKQSEKMASFEIKFKNRKTVWKYILTGKVYEKFTDLSIMDTQENGVSFKEGEFEIRHDWKVKCFESETEIPFRIDLNRRFQVLEKSKEGRQNGKLIHKQLPEAKPDQLYLNGDNTGIFYSHIYI